MKKLISIILTLGIVVILFTKIYLYNVEGKTPAKFTSGKDFPCVTKGSLIPETLKIWQSMEYVSFRGIKFSVRDGRNIDPDYLGYGGYDKNGSIRYLLLKMNTNEIEFNDKIYNCFNEGQVKGDILTMIMTIVGLASILILAFIWGSFKTLITTFLVLFIGYYFSLEISAIIVTILAVISIYFKFFSKRFVL